MMQNTVSAPGGLETPGQSARVRNAWLRVGQRSRGISWALRSHGGRGIPTELLRVSGGEPKHKQKLSCHTEIHKSCEFFSPEFSHRARIQSKHYSAEPVPAGVLARFCLGRKVRIPVTLLSGKKLCMKVSSKASALESL